MKQRAPLILALAACVLAALCLWQVMTVKSRLSLLDIRQDVKLSILEDAIHDIPDQVDSALQAQASLLAGYDVTYGEPDYNAGTIPLTVTATPKEFTLGLTAARLVCNGASCPMTAQEDGSFSVTLDLPLLQEADLQQVVFSEGNTQRIETLDRHELPGAEAIPLFTANLSYSYAFSGEQGILNSLSLYLNATDQPIDRTQWMEMTLIPSVDGKEGSPVPLDLAAFEGEEFDCLDETLEDLSFSLSPGSTLVVSLQATHTSGLRYVTEAAQLSITEEGVWDGTDASDPAAALYSPQGDLLWSGSVYDLF